jgi:hypothetical protein
MSGGGGAARTHLSNGQLDLDSLEARLSSRTGSATGASGSSSTGGGGGGAPKAKGLKWLKDTSSALKGPQMSLADEQRAQAAIARGEEPRGGAGGYQMVGGPEVSPSVHVKLPVLKSLRGTAAGAGGGTVVSSHNLSGGDRPMMIEVLLNDRLGKKVRIKCNSNDTIGDLKKLAAAQLGTRHEKLRIQKVMR